MSSKKHSKHPLPETADELTASPTSPCRQIPHFTITQAVLDKILATVGQRPAETGGMLGGKRTPEGGLITHFKFDTTGSVSAVSYSPDVAMLRPLLKEEWNPNGIDMAGFVHSHPEGFWQLSGGDKFYAQAILDRNPEIDFFFLPIVKTAGRQRSEPEVLFFAVARRGDGLEVLVPTVEVVATISEERLAAAVAQAKATPKPVFYHAGVSRPAEDATFARVATSFDLERLAQSRIIAVGCGGSAGFLEDLARCGVGEFILLDPDVVALTNLATQQTYRKDVGLAKVVALGQRLVDINPAVKVTGYACRGDELSPELWRALLQDPTVTGTTLLCGLTDSHPAQAQVNELALKYRLPSLCAQLYQGGAAVEVTFTDPELSRACHRCITSNRYAAYEAGYKNEVGSAGAPIFATTRLNALKGYIALALLHRDLGSQHPLGPAGQPWQQLLQTIATRNLALTRLSPHVCQQLGVRQFDQAFAGAAGAEQLLFDETLWRKQEPEHPATGYAQPCPDCGGTGRLCWQDEGAYLAAAAAAGPSAET